VEAVVVTVESVELRKGTVAQTLTLLAFNYPKLRKLTLRPPDLNIYEWDDRRALKGMGGYWDDYVASFQLLRQLEYLEIADVIFVPTYSFEDCRTGRDAEQEKDYMPQNFFCGMALKVSPTPTLCPKRF